MSEHDAYGDEMRRLCDEEIDRILAGESPAGDLEEVATFVRAARARLVAPPPAATEARHLAAIAEGRRADHPPRRPLARVATRIALAVTGAVLGTAGLAVAGVDLPEPAEDVLRRIGVEPTRPEASGDGQRPSDRGADAPEIPRDAGHESGDVRREEVDALSGVGRGRDDAGRARESAPGGFERGRENAGRGPGSADRGRQNAGRGDEQAGRGRENAERARENAERGRENAERGRENAERGRENAERGPDNAERAPVSPGAPGSSPPAAPDSAGPPESLPPAAPDASDSSGGAGPPAAAPGGSGR